MAQRLKNLRVTRVALCGAGMNQEAEIALYKAVPAEEPPITSEVAIVADETIETVAKADHDAVVAELDELKAKLAEIETPAPAEIDKAQLPEQVVKALEEAEAARAEVAKMRAERRAELFLAKAKDYGHVAAADELAPALEEIERVAPEAFQVVERALKSAEARIVEGGLFKTLGSDVEPAGDPNAEVEALVKQHVDGGMDRADAIRKVFRDRPELLIPSKA